MDIRICLLLIAPIVTAGMSGCMKAAGFIRDAAELVTLNSQQSAATEVGDGNVTTRNMGEMTFTAIEAATAAKVTVRSADDTNRDVILRVSENMAERVDLKVCGDVLKIGLRSDCYSFKTLSEVIFEVSVPHCDGLSSLEAVAAAQIDVTSPLTVAKVEIEATGAAKITAPLDCDWCEAEAAGASKVVLRGRCGSLELEASGASKVDAAECESRFCKAEASGASKAAVWCTGRLAAEASGASKVEYRGDCAVEQSSVSGLSSVNRIK